MATKREAAPTPADAVIPDPPTAAAAVTVADEEEFGLPAELLTLGRDGSAVIHLGATDVTVPPLTVGQIRQVFLLDDEFPLRGGTGPDGALGHGRWLEGLAKVVGADIPSLDDLPVWVLRPDLRMVLTRHWLTIPFH